MAISSAVFAIRARVNEKVTLAGVSEVDTLRDIADGAVEWGPSTDPLPDRVWSEEVTVAAAGNQSWDLTSLNGGTLSLNSKKVIAIKIVADATNTNSGFTVNPTATTNALADLGVDQKLQTGGAVAVVPNGKGTAIGAANKVIKVNNDDATNGGKLRLLIIAGVDNP